MSSTYRVSAGNVPVRVASATPEPPEDPIVPTPSQCRNLSALIGALTRSHGSQAALANRLGVSPHVVSRMFNARPRADRAFTIGRVFVETVAACVSAEVTVADVLAGRALARVHGGAA
jgi:DNA-binding transcriptional regulator YdaS (Cro superfamily)